MVWVARSGTGAAGRAGAKGGTGTDCRTRPGEAGQDRDGKRRNRKEETQRGRLDIFIFMVFALCQFFVNQTERG